jgi:hypothetical protein
MIDIIFSDFYLVLLNNFKKENKFFFMKINLMQSNMIFIAYILLLTHIN